MSQNPIYMFFLNYPCPWLSDYSFWTLLLQAEYFRQLLKPVT
jgi:hypothetical protein